MPALVADRATLRREVRVRRFPVLAGQKIFQGALVAINASGFARKGATATALKGVGVSLQFADNTAGADGALTVDVERGAWCFANSAAGDQITQADIGATAFIVDDQTVAKTNGSSTRSPAGVIVDVDAAGVWIEFA